MHCALSIVGRFRSRFLARPALRFGSFLQQSLLMLWPLTVHITSGSAAMPGRTANLSNGQEVRKVWDRISVPLGCSCDVLIQGSL